MSIGSIRAVEPAEFPWYDYRGFTFSLALAVDGHLYHSGHSGSAFDPAKGKPDVAGGMAEQAEVAYAKQLAVLAAGGLGASDVTRVVENVTVAGLEHYADAERVRRNVFGAHRPVVSTVVVDRLVRRKALIEVEVHASPNPQPPLTSATGTRWRRGITRDGHGGEVYLPTLLPVHEDGTVIAPGDAAAQYEHCLRRALELLAAAGLGPANVVWTLRHTTEATRRAASIDDIHTRLLGPVLPAGATITLSALHEPGVLVALDVVASRHVPVAIETNWAPFAGQARSTAVLAGDLLYVSGLTAADIAASSAGLDLRAQAETVYHGIERVMHAAGAKQLLSTVEYVTPDALAEYRVVADVRRELLREPYPVSTGLVCAALPAARSRFCVLATALITGST